MSERAESPPAELWSSILDSVSSTRSIPSKQILLLGEPGTGKSTVAAGLLHKPVESTSAATDFALGYDWADVKDDAEEDTLARLSILTLPSSAPAYLSLIPHFVPPKTALPNSLVMILLDWTKPWSFIEQLEMWLQWVEKWAKGDGSREMEIAREESRERLQSHLQHYTEPSSETAALPLAGSSISASTLLPLGSGTFTHNSAGVPIIVVCTKADLIDETPESLNAGPSGMGGMVKGKGSEWEERTDAVMQVLRTICLKYGAGLFYTSQQPATLQTLRQYALHLLFAPPAPSVAAAAGEGVAPTRNPFPFTHKPNTLDRDRILVPAGWDSWGKISVLREGFEAVRWGDAWESDLDSAPSREDHPPSDGAISMFRDIVGPDRSAKPPPLPELIEPTPEQGFLAKHYETLSRDPERDPRATFRQQRPEVNGTGAGAASNLHSAAATGPTGVVGPMGPSSFNLPNVERALVEMESTNEAPATGTGSRNRPANAPTRRTQQTDGRNPLAQVLPGTAGRAGGPASPISATRPAGDLGGPQTHEVLQNFFQSLLVNKNRGSTPLSASASSQTSTSPKATEPKDEPKSS